MPVNASLGKALKKKYGSKKGTSVYSAMDMSRQVWANRMNGDPDFDAPELERLAGIFNVGVNDLLNDPSDVLARIREWVTAVEAQAA